LERCLKNAWAFSDEVYVVDSFSTDNTVALAQKNGAQVLQNVWENSYAKQFNWALANLPIQSDWILRLDADEYLSEELIDELKERLAALEENITGVVFPLRRVFLNKHIRRGIGTMNLLRVFRNGAGFCEQRWMDEHIRLKFGEAVKFRHEFADHNLNGISWWTQKHNVYATREAIDLLNTQYGLFEVAQSEGKMATHAGRKRSMKLLYAKSPLFVRSAIYFFYRYIFLLGFTEGKEAFLWHFLQGWWYRTLVDAKVYEVRRACGNSPEKMRLYIRENFGIDVSKVLV
jgi:glycosyltransferase involved in cell wall biosynthesis